MQAQKVQVKIYAEQGIERPLESYIPAFHRWIQDSVLDELMIDVADYTHVPQGPGVLLVGHGFDLSLDEGEGRPGLAYFRKRALPEGAALVTDALRRVLGAAKLLDGDPQVTGPKGFSNKEILFRFPERLHLANDEPSFATVRSAIEGALSAAGLTGYSLSREGEPREPLTVRAQAT